jgi:O-antigen ligase
MRVVLSLLFSLVFCAHYLFLSTAFAGLDAQRLMLVIIMCVIALGLSAAIDRRGGAIFFAVIAGCISVGAYVTYVPIVKQITYLLLWLSLVTFFLFAGIDGFGSESTALVLAFCSILSMFLVIVCAFVYLDAGINIRWREIFAFVSNARFLNHFHVAAFLFLAHHATRTSGFWKCFSLLGLSATFFVVLVSAGRGVWISMACGVIIYSLIIRGRARVGMLKTLCICFLCGVCLFWVFAEYLVANDGGVGFSVRRELLSSSGRVYMWQRTISAILESPIFGYGAYSFALDRTMPATMPAHPHQHFLQLAYEYGLLVTIGLYVGITIFLVRAAVKIRQDLNTFAAVALASLIGLLINAQYSGVFTMPLGQLMVAASLGLLIGSLHVDRVYEVSARRQGVGKSSLVSLGLPIVLAFSCYYWAVILIDYADGFSGQPMEFNVQHEKVIFFPRTWDNAS